MIENSSKIAALESHVYPTTLQSARTKAMKTYGNVLAIRGAGTNRAVMMIAKRNVKPESRCYMTIIANFDRGDVTFTFGHYNMTIAEARLDYARR